MKESDALRGIPREEKHHVHEVSPAAERVGAKEAPGRAGRAAEDDWQALATEDPAFFIKTSDSM